MSFFYDLNKKLDSIRATPEVTHKQLNERDMSRAAKGYEKYGKEGMEALAKAGREGKALDPVRAKYDKYDNTEVDEGTHTQHAMDLNPDFAKTGRKPGAMDRMVQGAKKLADFVAPGDEKLLDRLQKSSGARRPSPAAREPNYMEAAKYRDPKYKDKLYTQEPPDYTYGPDMDDAYYNPKPDDYAGRKRPMDGGGGDPLTKGFRMSADKSINTQGKRKGMPSRDQITSLKGSIKDASGKHTPANFSDKIDRAKKEVDEMLGDVAAEAMKSALGKGKQPVRGMGEATKEIPGGRVHTAEPGGYGRKDDEDEKGKKVVAKTQRGRGRPKNNADSDTGEVMKPDFSAFGVTGKDIKLPKHKGAVTKHKMVGENDQDPKDQGEYDQEGDMAKEQMHTIMSAAKELHRILRDDENLPEWVQKKITLAKEYIDTARDYMLTQHAERDEEQPIAEKAVSKNQAVAARIARGVQKGEAKAKPGSASAEMAKMEPKELKKFAKTDTKGLPKKKKEVEETTTSGSVATSGAAPKAAKGSGGMTFGKGIYDSMNRELEGMISESMSMNMSMNNDEHGGPTRSLTVTATDEDATRLALLLKSAGLGGSDHDYHTMDENYGVNEVSQNAPDYPTNTETAEDNFEYSGGLNKPKSTGQTTVPVIAGQGDRTGSYAESEQDALQRMMEMSGLREAKGKPDFLDLDKDGDKQEPMKKAANDKKTKVQEADTEFAESIQRMREIAGLDKKAVDEEKTEEGNLFTKGLEDDNIKVGDKIPGTNATKTKDIDESIFALTNQWRAYKG